MANEVIRSVEEIKARRMVVETDDFLGVMRGDLLEGLPFSEAQPHLIPGVTEEQWDESRENVHGRAVKYLEFAAGKAAEHRGISAGRSVDHYRAWLWLLYPDEVVTEFEATPYPQYGVPMLRKAAEILGAEDQWTVQLALHPELARMQDGDLCEPGCQMGCGG